MHVHAPHDPSDGMARPLRWALGINLAFAAVEFVAGTLAGSIALLSDAVHNLSDVPAMALSLFALYSQRKPADELRTYGYQRSGVLAAFVNGLLLVGVGGFIIWEAVARVQQPAPVVTGIMVWVSAAGLLVNGGIAWMMVRGHKDLNLRTILIHNAGDAASNAAILVGALVIGWSGLYIIDPLLGAVIGAGILWSSVSVLRETTHILLEGTPRNLEIETVAQAMLTVTEVEEVHDVHIWSLGSNHNALSCHVRVLEMSVSQSALVLTRLKTLLEKEFQISHTTIQLEPAARAPALHTLTAENNKTRKQ